VSQNLILASTTEQTPARPAANIQAVGIVIPTRNHANVIGECIAGLFAANNHSGWHHSLWIVVIVAGSTDETAKIARRALGAFGQVLEISAQSRQVADRLGAATVIDHFRHVPRHALLMTSTAATSDLPREWIERLLKSSRAPFGLRESCA
jgi:hypothetical protein